MSGRPLPGVLAEIEELVGREKALDLALALGGQSIHVPRAENMASDHPLAVALGGHAATVARRHAGECLYVPMARRELVVHLTAEGKGTADIAAILRISKSAVRRYRQ